MENKESKTEATEKQIEPVYNPVKVEESEVLLLAALIESESGGEAYYPMMCTGNVVLNRVTDRKTMSKVIFQRNQFHGTRTKDFKERKASSRAIEASFDLLSGTRVLGSEYIYFMNPKTATDRQMFAILKACPLPIYAGSQVYFY